MEILYEPEKVSFKILCYNTELDAAVALVQEAIIEVEKLAMDSYPDSFNLWGILEVCLQISICRFRRYDFI